MRGEASSCGLCLVGHVCLRQAISVFWLVTVPFKWLETVVFGGPAWYLSLLADLDVHLMVASFLVGLCLSNALRVLGEWHFDLACTTYLSVVTWLSGAWFVSALASRRLLPLLSISRACGQDVDTAQCRWLYTLGEPGYFGLLAGFLLYFLEVSFDPDTGDWCRASEAWPAEALYVPAFFVSCLSSVVHLPQLRIRPQNPPLARMWT